jgi:hypothetical protein
MGRSVQRDDGATRYEITVDGALGGHAEFREVQGATVFTHTVVDDAMEGQGVGSDLVRGALDDVRTRGGTVVPLCSFVRSWIERHEGYEDLVDHDLVAQLRP